MTCKLLAVPFFGEVRCASGKKVKETRDFNALCGGYVSWTSLPEFRDVGVDLNSQTAVGSRVYFHICVHEVWRTYHDVSKLKTQRIFWVMLSFAIKRWRLCQAIHNFSSTMWTSLAVCSTLESETLRWICHAAKMDANNSVFNQNNISFSTKYIKWLFLVTMELMSHNNCLIDNKSK